MAVSFLLRLKNIKGRDNKIMTPIARESIIVKLLYISFGAVPVYICTRCGNCHYDWDTEGIYKAS